MIYLDGVIYKFLINYGTILYMGEMLLKLNDEKMKNIWNESERVRKLRNFKWGDTEVCWTCNMKD
ncbi:hypothetical protein [Clostridium sp. KNHs214]|uniref:hypothetical protein n=1 Tax=Clostridium sp. KNHs214 TaxID=1540257 RepID=UPI00163B2D20|nr:hypothetical protein [Clostridium sp. KNHs214]